MPPLSLPPRNRLSRVKSIVGALLIASALIGFMLAALVLGSIVALLLIIAVVVGLTLAAGKEALRRLSKTSLAKPHDLSRTRPEC